MATQKILYILRHAKAENGTAHQDDHSRQLNATGREAATAMGEYLKTQGVRPDSVICSTAARARETYALVQPFIAPETPTDWNDRLYLASVNETLQLLSHMEETQGRVLIVGHNPGLHQFCLKLARSGAAELMDTLSIKFPTCAFAAIALGDTPWRDLQHAHGELKMFVTPSMLGNLEE